MTTFLWAIIVVMGVALISEMVALIGLALTVRGASQRLQQSREEVSQSIRGTKQVLEGMRQSLAPHAEAIRRDSNEIALLAAARGRNVKATFEDFDRRNQRLRVRFETDGARALERLRSGKQMVEEGASVLRVVGTALWLLRRVA